MPRTLVVAEIDGKGSDQDLMGRALTRNCFCHVNISDGRNTSADRDTASSPSSCARATVYRLRRRPSCCARAALSGWV